MSTPFDATAEEFLRLMGRNAHVKNSVRAPGNPPIGYERSGPGLDYLFLTQDALCFLQPNPAPPVLVRLPLSVLTHVEWNGTNLFFEADPDADVSVAEGSKGWGKRVKGVKTEKSEAGSFFTMCPSWAIQPRDLAFADSVASAAGLSRQDDPELRELSITRWRRIEPSTTVPEEGLPETTATSELLIEDKFTAHSREEDGGGPAERVGVDAASVTLDAASCHFVGAPDRFNRLFEAFQDDSRVMDIGGLRPDDAEVPEQIDGVFQANAQRAYHALPGGSDEFRHGFAKRMYTLMIWGWVATEALLGLRGLPTKVDRPLEDIRGRADSLYQDFDVDSMSDAGFYVVDNLRGYTVAQFLEIPTEVAASNMLPRWMIQQGEQAVLLGVTFAMAAAGVRDL